MNPEQILASLSQLDHQKRPVTLVAGVFFMLICLSLGGMQGYSVWTAREVQLKDATTASANLTRALSAHVSYGVERADSTLLDLAEQRQHALDNPGFPLEPFIAERLRRLPLLRGLSMYDAQATELLASPAGAPQAATVQAHLAYHQQYTGRELFIGAAERDGVTGEWLMPVSRRLDGPEGRMEGVAIALIRLGGFSAFHEQMDIGTRGKVLLALESGQVLLSRPARDAVVGADLRGTALFGLRQRSGPAHSQIVPSSDSKQPDTLYSYRRVAGYPLLVSVARSTDEILENWWDSAYLSTAGVSLLILIQLWLGVRLYGQVTLRDQLEKERRTLQKLLVKKSRSLRQQALRDALTGIANRRQFDTRLLREFNRAIAEGRSLALIILDVDHFKKYNDLYGHPAGDACLKFVADRINSGRRRTQDLAARLGGEEFAVLLPETSLRGAIAVAEAIRKSVAAQRLTHLPDQPHSVTVSCGVHAMVPTRGMQPSELIDAADRALYLAKASGRNRVRAEGTMPPTRGKRLSLVINK